MRHDNNECYLYTKHMTITNQPATGKYKYSDKTIKYYENLKHVGALDENLINVGTGIVGSPLCGDVMKVQLMFNNDIIIDVKYKVFGCVSAIASMEFVSEKLKGLTINQALEISNEEVANSLSLSEIKKHCSVLAKECIQAAIDNYRSKQKGQEEDKIIITDKAAIEMKKLIQEHKCLGVNITVTNGGCSGIAYILDYAEKQEINDVCIKIKDILFFYKKDIEMFIPGLSIDLVENSFGPGFSITNKNHVACANCTCCR